MQTVCVIDQNKMYVDFVVKNEDGSLIGYELQPGETVVKTSAPNMKFLRPKWDGLQWVETATPEELEEREENKPTQEGENEISRIAQVELALMELAEIVGGL